MNEQWLQAFDGELGHGCMAVHADGTTFHM